MSPAEHTEPSDHHQSEAQPPQLTEDSSMTTGIETEAAKALAEFAVKEAAPSLIEYGKMLFGGKTILILGPERSGKTNLFHFLDYLILEPERVTNNTVSVKTGRDKSLKIGPANNDRILRIRKPRDVPGLPAKHHIPYILEYRPRCIVVVVDATKMGSGPSAESPLEWLREFCKYLNSMLLRERSVSKRLKSIIIVLNKWDKVLKSATLTGDTEDDRKLRTTKVEEVRTVLGNTGLSPETNDLISVLPCCLVCDSTLCYKLATQLINRIAVSLEV
jgi:hypothetical protein